MKSQHLGINLLIKLKLKRRWNFMAIDKKKVRTQDDLNEQAPIDQVEDRVEAKMKKIEGSAKKNVAESLRNRKLAREGQRLEEEAERELKKAE
jgi:uncharacterized protein YjbJ (UPF0337 family)